MRTKLALLALVLAGLALGAGPRSGVAQWYDDGYYGYYDPYYYDDGYYDSYYYDDWYYDSYYYDSYYDSYYYPPAPVAIGVGCAGAPI